MSRYAPTVSIVVPFFNAGRSLSACVEALLRQTLTGTEIILVDDGSSDDSRRIASELAARDARVVVSSQRHVGPGHARNCGLDLATAPYVVFVDSDDELSADGCELLVRTGIETGADLVVAKSQNWRGPALPKRVDRAHAIRSMYGGQISMGVWAKLYRRAFLDAHGVRFHPSMYIEDRNFLLQCLIAGARLAPLARVVYRRVVRDDSAMHRVSEKHVLDASAAYELDALALDRAGLISTCGYGAAVATLGVDLFLDAAIPTGGEPLRALLASELERQEALFGRLPGSRARIALLAVAASRLRREVEQGRATWRSRVPFHLARWAS